MNNNDANLDWMLNKLVADVVGVEYAVVLASDGIPQSKSDGLDKEHADKMAAVAAGLRSVARTVSGTFGKGPTLQNFVEMQDGYFFVVDAGQGACLAVVTNASVNVGMVANAMNRLTRRLGEHWSSAPRVVGQSTAGGS